MIKTENTENYTDSAIDTKYELVKTERNSSILTQRC